MKINRKISLINFYDSNRSKSNIKYIILHYVGAVSTAKNNADYFYSTFRGASAHYFVDEKEIWQVVEDNDSAWAIGADKYYTEARNTNSISIEMCCYKNSKGKLDIKEEVVNKAIELTKYLMEKYDIDMDHVIRHYDATRKVCPAPFVNDEERWNEFKKALGDKSISSSTSEKVVTTVKVIHKNGLNLRKASNTNSGIIKAFPQNTTLKIYEIDKNWGRTDGGWICLDYTDYKKSTNSSGNSSKYTTGRYEINTDVLTVRKGPGTKYDWLRYSQLSSNAQKQIYNICGYKPNGLCRGVQCDVSQVNGNWGKIPSGWICLDYCKKI